jgi:hypothetical protein
MTATTSNIGTRRGQGMVLALRRMVLAGGWLLAAIGAGWKAFAEAGQMGPDTERSISRHTGARI